jgi:hypothetical protein
MKQMKLAMLAVGLLLAAQARATLVIAYDNPAGITSGIQDWGNNLGLGFYANQNITISALGAFDNGVIGNLAGANGSSGVTVQMYQITGWNPSATLAAGTATGQPVGSPITFSPSSPGTQINGDAFKSQSIALTAGNYYCVVAFNDINYNSQGGPNPYTTLNSFGGAITFEHYTLYDSGASGIAFPTTIDNWGGGGPTDRYAAGTFAVPEPTTMVAGALLLIPFGLGTLRSLRQIRAA